MAYSGLTTVVMPSPNYTAKRKYKIDTITIHHMAGVGTATSCGNIFLKPSREASANYGVGNDGSIGCYVDENSRAWTTGSKRDPRGAENDHRAVTFEVSNSAFGEPWPVSSEALNALVALLVDICYRNGIQELKWRGDPDLIGQIDIQNMTVHRWFDATACPGTYLMEHMGSIAAAVNEQLGNMRGFRQSIGSAFASNGLEWTEYSGMSNSRYTGLSGEGGTGGTSSGSVALSGTGGASPYYVTPCNIVDYTDRLTCTKYEQRPSEVGKITVHIARQSGSAEDLTTLLNSTDRAYNYGIDSSGKIVQYVEEYMMTNSTPNIDNDKVAVQIICMNEETANQSLSNSCWNSLIMLCADICYRNDIEYLVYTDNPKLDTLTAHKQFQLATNCPGKWLISKYHDLCDAVNRYLDMYRNQSINQGYIKALQSTNTITIANQHPYIIRVDEGALDTDYEALIEMGVVGAMINAGQHFNKMHKEVPYRSETVYEQAKEAEEAGVPYGFYYTTHARNIDEVRSEAYWFYFVISKYPPKLGAWLHCEFDVGEDVAYELVDKWYEYFVDWGLKAKCGLYCSKEQAELIGWPLQSTYMPLWLEQGATVSAAPADEILVPSFFSWMYTMGQNI